MNNKTPNYLLVDEKSDWMYTVFVTFNTLGVLLVISILVTYFPGDSDYQIMKKKEKLDVETECFMYHWL